LAAFVFYLRRSHQSAHAFETFLRLGGIFFAFTDNFETIFSLIINEFARSVSI